MKRKIGIIILISILLVGIIAVVYILSRPHYRSVKLDEYEGSVSLTRQDKTVEPYKGVMLIPGDFVETMQDSFAALSVDNDKHLGVKENTKLSINAAGTDTNGKVTIDLEYGEALFEIENKLNVDSSFEVSTPNAVLAVRGTTFDVYYSKEENTSKINVEEGTVAVNYGADYKKQLILNAGESVIITGYEVLNDSTGESEEQSDTETNDGEYLFDISRQFVDEQGFNYGDYNERGEIKLIKPGESYRDSAYDESIYNTYFESHEAEINKFILEAKEQDAVNIFTGFSSEAPRTSKDVTEWLQSDINLTVDGNELLITKVSVYVEYGVYDGDYSSVYGPSLIINPDSSDDQKEYAKVTGVRFAFWGIKEE